MNSTPHLYQAEATAAAQKATLLASLTESSAHVALQPDGAT